MHRKESQVHTDEEGSEVNLTQGFVISDANHLLDSVVETSEDSKNSTHRKDVVEMRNNVISHPFTRLAARAGLDFLTN